MPGWCNSTPAIWREAVFVTTRDADRLLLLRLDGDTGKVVWQRHNMATPSPVTDGKHVWAHFGNGDLACYDFSGQQICLTNLPERFGPYSNWWGHGNSPVLFEDLLISVCMQNPKGDGKSYIVAHDKLTARKNGTSSATPAPRRRVPTRTRRPYSIVRGARSR